MKTAETTIRIADLDCADCAAKLETAVGRVPGVRRSAVSFAAGTLRVEYERTRVDRARLVAEVVALGHRVEPDEPPAEVTSEFRVTGLDCADCAVKVERALGALDGVASARLDFATGVLKVRHAARTDPADLVRAVETAGYDAVPLRARQPVAERSFWTRNRRAWLTAGSGLALALGALSPAGLSGGASANVLFALAMLLGGYHVARAGLYYLWRSRALDMNALMTIAVVGAAAIGEWSEGATVVFLFALGNTLEGYTVDRARGAIRALMSLAPREARVRREGVERAVPAESVAVGEIVVVRPGEMVPVDGRVVAGASSVNQASITGEPVPVEKGVGGEVFAGSLNERGYLEVEATKPYSENTISRVIQLVEEAQAQRAPSQRFVDRFARYYTPAVIAAAVAVATLPWLLLGQPFVPWFYRALVLLVIACPCALVISTPVSVVSAIARAAGLGILIKGGAYLEETARLRVVAFDKTGTLTRGRPEVTDVIPLAEVAAEEVLHLAAAVEARSEHPLASAVLRRNGAAERDAAPDGALAHAHEVADFEAVLGRGVRALVDGAAHYVGSPRFFQEMGWPLGDAAARIAALQGAGKTVLLVGSAGRLIGAIAVADRLRPDAAEAVRALRSAGVERLVLLSGDHEETARAIAREVGVDEYRAGLLPEDKVGAVRELRARYGRVAMVGDGVNDAPALAAADVGMAMGVAGTDVALEAADVALMSDDLRRVASAIDLARRAVATIRWNVAFSLLVKACFLALTLSGVVTLWLAILADTGTSILVTLNGMRLLRHGRGASGEGRRGASPDPDPLAPSPSAQC